MTVTAQDIDEKLIAPLNALWGGVRPKGMSVAAFKAGLERLRTDLRYLSPEQLPAVVHEAQMMAAAFKTWPIAGLIIERADRLFPNPDLDRARQEGVARFMRCRVGQDALEGDYAVELLADLRARGPHYVAVTGNRMQIERWQEKAHTRRLAKERAARTGDDAEAAYWQEREQQARALVMAPPSAGPAAGGT